MWRMAPSGLLWHLLYLSWWYVVTCLLKYKSFLWNITSLLAPWNTVNNLYLIWLIYTPWMTEKQCRHFIYFIRIKKRPIENKDRTKEICGQGNNRCCRCCSCLDILQSHMLMSSLCRSMQLCYVGLSWWPFPVLVAVLRCSVQAIHQRCRPLTSLGEMWDTMSLSVCLSLVKPGSVNIQWEISSLISAIICGSCQVLSP